MCRRRTCRTSAAFCHIDQVKGHGDGQAALASQRAQQAPVLHNLFSFHSHERVTPSHNEFSQREVYKD